MKIAFYEIAGWEAEYIKPKLEGHEMLFYPGKFTDTDLPKDNADILSMFVGCKVTPQVLAAAPNLKLVATRTTGYDHINLAACEEKGIVVSSVPVYGQNTVAELAFGLILTLSRKLFPAIKRVREQGSFSYDGFRGFDLEGKTLGVVGTGHIGAYAIKIAKGFGMKVIGYDPFPSEKLSLEYGFDYMTLEKLLAASDIVNFARAVHAATHHLINKDNIKLMKKGSYLINTARGGLVETDALEDALKNGILAGAGMDVLEEEGYVIDELSNMQMPHPNEEKLKLVLAEHELMHMDNVIITPHMAAQTTEALKRILDTTVENIKAFAAGNPVNLVKQK